MKERKLTELQAKALEQLKKGDVYFHDGQKAGFCLEGMFEKPEEDAKGVQAFGKRREYYGLVSKGFAQQEDIWSGLQLTSHNPITGFSAFQNFRTRRFTLSEISE